MKGCPKASARVSSPRTGTRKRPAFQRERRPFFSIEGYLKIFKRGLKGVDQHCGKQHRHRYLVEFGFRYNNRSAFGEEDITRHVRAFNGMIRERLTYRDSSCARTLQ
ncbi:MAG: transposase [Methylocystis sp.]|nr:transposase [Methylocystis sp.]MCA3589034.1 transposase [Methylocystis sp.]MCA3592340.1 transposase [Methylocystis sp.]